jgi:ClpP class serine protease
MKQGASFLAILANLARLVFWLLLISVLISPWLGSTSVESKRAALLEELQNARRSRVMTLIHREEEVNFFGIPVNTYINVDDSEAVLRAIRLTPSETPIDLILHTPGRLVLAASQIAHALKNHKGKVTVFVPHYAMSGGTLLALAADGIVMDANAVLGPVDPQIGELPAASIVALRGVGHQCPGQTVVASRKKSPRPSSGGAFDPRTRAAIVGNHYLARQSPF